MAVEFAAATNKSTNKSVGNHATRDQKTNTASEQEDNDSDADETRSINSDNSVIEQLHLNPYAELEDDNDSSVTEVHPDKGALEREAEGTTELTEANRKERKKQRAIKRLAKEAKDKALKRAKKREAKEQREKENRYDHNTLSNPTNLLT